MNINLKKKKVLITGSTKGIGLGIAKKLNSLGCTVILNSREKVSKNFLDKNFNSNVDYFKFDNCSNDDVKKKLKSIKKKYKSVDFLICNVGSSKTYQKKNKNIEEFNRMFELNFFSSIVVIENFLNIFKNKNSLKIICISSTSANYISNAPLAYIVSKSALNSYVKAKSKSLNKNTTINAIAPGNILFKGGRWASKLKSNSRNVMKQIKVNVPLNRFGELNEVTNLVAYVLSDNSNFINGSILTIDGGQDKSI